MLISLFDIVAVLLVAMAAALAAPVYAAWLGVWALAARLAERRGAPGPRRSLLVLSEASNFDELRQAGLLTLFEEWLLDGYFDHLYLTVFHAPAARRHRVSGRFTVIDLAKRARWLKRAGCWRTYTVVNAIAVTAGVLGLRRLAWREAAVIRGCNPHHMGLLSLALGRLTGRPHCVSIHSDNPAYHRLWKQHGRWQGTVSELFGSRALTRRLMAFVYRHAPEVWIIRESFREEALRCGTPPERIRLFPHDSRVREQPRPDPAAWRRAHGLEGRPLIVSVGRLAVENYVDDLPRIAAALARVAPEAMFVIIGGGAEQPRLEAAADALGVQAQMRWLGWQSNDTARAWRWVADVNLCLRGGYSLIEAAAAGRPVIAYDTDWHGELVQTGATGALVPVADTAAAARAIHEFLAHPAEAARQGAHARELALARHDHAVVTPLKQRMYDQLIGHRCNETAALAPAWSLE